MERKGWVLTQGCAPQVGWTPLHMAADSGNLEVARALVQAGADITAKNNVSEREVGGEG